MCVVAFKAAGQVEFLLSLSDLEVDDVPHVDCRPRPTRLPEPMPAPPSGLSAHKIDSLQQIQCHSKNNSWLRYIMKRLRGESTAKIANQNAQLFICPIASV